MPSNCLVDRLETDPTMDQMAERLLSIRKGSLKWLMWWIMCRNSR